MCQKDIFIPSKEQVTALTKSADFCDAFSAKMDDLMAEKSLAVTYKNAKRQFLKRFCVFLISTTAFFLLAQFESGAQWKKMFK